MNCRNGGFLSCCLSYSKLDQPSPLNVFRWSMESDLQQTEQSGSPILQLQLPSMQHYLGNNSLWTKSICCSNLATWVWNCKQLPNLPPDPYIFLAVITLTLNHPWGGEFQVWFLYRVPDTFDSSIWFQKYLQLLPLIVVNLLSFPHRWEDS